MKSPVELLAEAERARTQAFESVAAQFNHNRREGFGLKVGGLPRGAGIKIVGENNGEGADSIDISAKHGSIVPTAVNLSAAFLTSFCAKVRVRPNGCWEWTGATSKKRYDQRRPYCWLNGKAVNAARVMCAWVCGEPPPHAHAGHICPGG